MYMYMYMYIQLYSKETFFKHIIQTTATVQHVCVDVCHVHVCMYVACTWYIHGMHTYIHVATHVYVATYT